MPMVTWVLWFLEAVCVIILDYVCKQPINISRSKNVEVCGNQSTKNYCVCCAFGYCKHYPFWRHIDHWITAKHYSKTGNPSIEHLATVPYFRNFYCRRSSILDFTWSVPCYGKHKRVYCQE